MAGESRLRTLVLYAQYTDRLSYYDDWLAAFEAAPCFDVAMLNICAPGVRGRVSRGLAECDLVVLLHSTNGDTTIYLEPLLPLFAERRATVLTFVGNEVNLPGSPIAAKRAAFMAMRPDFIATQLPLEAGEYLFGDCVLRRVIAVPHALNPDVYRPEVPHAARRLDIGVRAVRYLPHLGDDDRNRIHAYFSTHAARLGLAVEISDTRLDRAGWARFLNDTRGTVSTEAGSWYLERDDATVNAIRAHTAAQHRGSGLVIANDSPLRRLGHRLPYGVRAFLRAAMSRGPVRHESAVNEALAHDEIHDRFFRDRPRAPVYGKCISSRHFDAIGTKTCQIMFEGRFNGILTAGEHYIPLAPDFSDAEEAVATFRDDVQRQRIVDAAHAHVMDRHTYARRMQDLHAAVAGG